MRVRISVGRTVAGGTTNNLRVRMRVRVSVRVMLRVSVRVRVSVLGLG